MRSWIFAGLVLLTSDVQAAGSHHQVSVGLLVLPDEYKRELLGITRQGHFDGSVRLTGGYQYDPEPTAALGAVLGAGVAIDGRSDELNQDSYEFGDFGFFAEPGLRWRNPSGLKLEALLHAGFGGASQSTPDFVYGDSEKGHYIEWGGKGRFQLPLGQHLALKAEIGYLRQRYQYRFEVPGPDVKEQLRVKGAFGGVGLAYQF